MPKEAIITSNRLNSYGTRVLTEGLNMEQYSKNPVLLYMHNRDKMPIGIIENLRVDGDIVYGTPKFDGDTEEEKIIAQKWERGTLRMLSAGIDILEFSEDPEQLTEGQTRPTITKSKLVEVSVVDIGANDDALQTRLYQGGKPLTLAKEEESELLPLLKAKTENTTEQQKPKKKNMEKILQSLGLAATASEEDAVQAIEKMKQKETDMKLARITDAVESAIKEKRITADKKEHFIELGKKAGLEALGETLACMTPAQKPMELINRSDAPESHLESGKKWDELSEKELEALRMEHREDYARLFKEKYGFAPTFD
jgi:HK97 family phage prohead protease